MRRWLPVTLIMTALFLMAAVPQQAQPQIGDIAVFYTYAEEINFQAHIQSDQTIDKVFLCFEPANRPVQIFEVPLTSQGEVLYRVDLTQTALRPFTQVTYWFQLESGAITTTSEKYHFFYEDNRKPWQSTRSENFIINWINGDAAFGQAALNAAQTAFDALCDTLAVNPPVPLSIYIYPTPQELQFALSLTNQPWAAGHTDPDLNVLVLSIAATSEANLEFERQIPHEMAHIFLFHSTGTNYDRLPIWLNEGIASQAEIYPNADYARAVSTAASSGDLINFDTLCNIFPMDASGAFLSYAQSASLVQYISTTYGSSGLQALIDQYKDGKGCEEGVQSGLGISLAQLQNRWQQDALNTSVNSQVWAKLRPFAWVGAFMLLPPILLGLFMRTRRG